MHQSRASVLYVSRLLGAATLLGCYRPPPPALEDITPVELSDSVAVGYGMRAKRDLTTAVASVSGDAARRNSPTTLADMIDGRFAGVEVRRLASGGVSVRIRGSHTFRGDAEPLYVVDGVPQHASMTGLLLDIDPRDVKSIEILKDAGATAIYGARGANGVILITTRRADDY